MSLKSAKCSIAKNKFELEMWPKGLLVAGIDEVGRGCLAGPVVAAAAMLTRPADQPLLRDSKVLSEKKRVEAYNWIIKNCWFGVGIVHHRTIDSDNIYQASRIAMKRAFMALMAATPNKALLGAILTDAMPLNFAGTSYQHTPVLSYPKGEDWSCSIAAASIVAKITRDHLMAQLDTVFPGYQLNVHKGYSTKIHQHAILKENRSIIHRMSFLRKLLSNPQKDDHESQKRLF